MQWESRIAIHQNNRYDRCLSFVVECNAHSLKDVATIQMKQAAGDTIRIANQFGDGGALSSHDAAITAKWPQMPGASIG